MVPTCPRIPWWKRPGNLAELRARHDYEYGLPGGVTRPSEPGPTAVANEAAPHRTDADAASARGPSSSGLFMVGVDWSEIVASSSSLIDFDHGHDDDDYGISVDETTWGKGATTTPTTATDEEQFTTENHRVRKSGVMDDGVRSSVLGGELW